MLHKILINVTIILSIASSIVFTLSVNAQFEGIPITAEYTFGEKLKFSVDVPDEVDISKLWIFFRIEGEQQTRIIEAQFQESGSFTIDYDLSAYPIRAFTEVVYWVEAEQIDGEDYKSDPKSIFYEDNRFEWQSRQTDWFRVHWYDGDAQFAQTMLDVAELGLNKAEELTQFSLENMIEIYAYANAQEMRTVLLTRGPSWIGAHADPDLSVMVISLPPGPEQRLEMERQIPHELLHILLYQELGTNYESLPVWLNEGLASMAELYPNPDYLVLLNKAQSKDTLLSISSLCQTFPREASGAFLAYAQATSFTRFLLQQYGSTSLRQLIENYANGMDCERGIQTTYDITITQLEREWRHEAFSENTLIVALESLAPWLIVMGIVLLVPLALIISSRNRKAPTKQSTS